MNCRKVPPTIRFVLSVLAIVLVHLVAHLTYLSAETAQPHSAPKDAAELQAIEGKVKQVVAKVLPSVVGIQVGASQGSGVLVSEDGLVMTAGHVVGKPDQEVTFILSDGKTAKGKTLGMYSTLDAGLMRITESGKKWPFVEKGSSKDLKPGTWCVAMGHPLGYQEGRPPVIRVGRVLQVADNALQTDCPLVGGDSGGPLLDLDGKVIGINSRIGGPTDMNFHVPVHVFIDHWDRLVKGESWQLTLPGRDSSDVKCVFRPIVAEAGKCVVRIKCDGKDTGLGTIVGPDGWVVTKASELKGKIVCRLKDGRELDATMVGIHEPFDLAMLRVDAARLPIIPWNNKQPEVGQWVAAPGLDDDPLALGVVSVPRRPIPAMGGMLGIMLKAGDGPAEIEQVMPKSPAESAGLKAQDIVTEVNGKKVANRQELIGEIRKQRPGMTVRLAIRRAGQELTVVATLKDLDTPEMQQRNMQNSMGVGVSRRRDAFPLVLQHDTVLRPADCGGPLVDLSGKVVGINVAHGGRTETYCVPADVLVVLMYDLMSGRLNPIFLAEKRLDALKELVSKAVAEQKTAEEQVAAAKAAFEKAAAEHKTMAEQAAVAKTAADQAASDHKAAEARLADAKTLLEKTSADRNAAVQQIAAAKAATDKALAEQKDVEPQLTSARAAVDKGTSDVKAAEAELAALKAAMDKAVAEQQSAAQQFVAAKASAEQAAANQKAAQQEVATAQTAFEQAAAEQKPAAQQALIAAQQKLAEANAAAQAATPKHEAAQQQANAAQASMDRAAADHKAAEDRLGVLKAEAEKAAAQLKAVEAQAAASKAAVDQAMAALKQAEDRGVAAAAEAEKAATEQKAAEERLVAAKAAVEKTGGELKTAEERSAAAKAVSEKASAAQKGAEEKLAASKAVASKAGADQKAAEDQLATLKAGAEKPGTSKPTAEKKSP